MTGDGAVQQAGDAFPAGFFERDDDSSDTRFYAQPRLVTHIDGGAIRAVADLYAELGVGGRVLDLMSSWVSHLPTTPDELVVLGMNAAELDANPQAARRIVQDLNVDQRLPLPDASFDAVLCCVSIDYLTRPVEVLAEAARVLRPGAPVVVTFSNRCFPTKAIRGWLTTGDEEHCAIVAEYLRLAGGFDAAESSLRRPRRSPSGGTYRGDPLYAVVARRAA